MLTEKTVKAFLDAVASSSPAPGGGSVSALAGALGTALTTMVCNLTMGKKKYETVQQDMIAILEQATALQLKLTHLVDNDTEAFNGVMAAYALPKETEEQKEIRSEAIQEATKKATLVPVEILKLSDHGIVLAKEVAEKGNSNSISDAGVAALMLRAACEGAVLNININLGILKDKQFVEETKAFAVTVLAHARLLTESVLKRVEVVLH